MSDIFRVVTWNCRRATIASGVWDYLLEMNPDVALLQEVNSIPEKVNSVYRAKMHLAINKVGSPQKFKTALLVKGRISNELILSSHEKWIEEELQRFSGNLVALEILPDKGPSIRAVSVYGPAWPLDRERLSGIDVTGVRLKQNRDVWVMDLIWASLKHQIDLLFVSPVLAERLITCDTGSFNRVFNSGLSDHLPIVADFRLTN